MAETYIYHFCSPVGGYTSSLTCYNLAFELDRAAVCKKPKQAENISEPFVATEKTIAAEWKEIAKLGWVYLSDHRFSSEELRERLAVLDTQRIRLAFQRIQVYVCCSLDFEGTPFATLLQFMALGPDNLTLAGTDKEFRKFLEKEIQDVDLLSLL